MSAVNLGNGKVPFACAILAAVIKVLLLVDPGRYWRKSETRYMVESELM
jgi:hypothetical protein